LAIRTFFFVEMWWSDLGHFIFMKTSFYMAKSYFSYRILAKTLANQKQTALQVERDVHLSLLLGGVLVTTLRERETRIGNCVGGLVPSTLS
jgi:hypothetical protein